MNLQLPCEFAGGLHYCDPKVQDIQLSSDTVHSIAPPVIAENSGDKNLKSNLN